MLLPLFTTLIDDSADFVLVLQIVLLVLAIILLGWAAKVIYDALPGWLSSVRFDMPVGTGPEVACLNCGQLNPAAVQYCGHCGNALPQRHDVDGS
jgi:hypothetical protein